MLIDSYLHGIDEVTAATRVQKRVSILSTKLLPKEIAPTILITLPAGEPPDNVGTLAGMAVGGILWSDHRFLGMTLGASLGRNIPALLQPETRRSALCNMAQTTGGVVVSLVVGGDSTMLQLAGFALGWVGAGVALYYGGVRDGGGSTPATVIGAS